jgi:hypothetical protein
MKVQEIHLAEITGNPYQTRLHFEKEPLMVLAKSIRERGLFNPVTLLQKSEHEFIVVHGHRRVAAYKKLRLKTIPAFVKPKSEENSLTTDLIHENLIREDLSVQEKALSMKLLFSQTKSIKDDIDAIISCITGFKLYKVRGGRKEEGKGSGTRGKTKWSTDDMFECGKLLKSIGVSENNAISYLNVLKLPPRIQRMVSFNVHNDQGEKSSKRISIRLANSLARVDDESYRDYLLERAIQGTSARHIDAMVSNYKLKVLKGEWKGYVKKFNNLNCLKSLDQNLFIELSDKCSALAKRLNTFKLTKLSALAETMEKDVFIASSTALQKDLRLLDEQLKKHMESKGYVSVEHRNLNEPFEIEIKDMQGKKNVRGTIPLKLLRRLGVDPEKLNAGTFVQLKIVGIKEALNV